MNLNEYERMYTLEDRYWWFVARRRLAMGLLERFGTGGRVLDLGCGTGVVLSELQAKGEAVGLDMSARALEFCVARGLADLVQGDGRSLPFGDARFGAIVGLDVFEHIDDDVRAFQEALRSLAPGGILVMSVPAFRSLWGPHDVALMHHRRYRRSEVVAKLESAGFEVVKVSYSIFFLFPVVALIRFFEKRKKGPPKADLVPVPHWVNAALIGLQGIEARLIHAVGLPWGSSVVAVGRKPR